MRIRSVAAELFVPCGRTDGRTHWQTDMTKLIVAFLNIPNAPKSEGKYAYCSTLNVGAKNSKKLFFTAGMLSCDTSAATHGRQYLRMLLLYISVEVIHVYSTGTLQSLLSYNFTEGFWHENNVRY